MDKILAKPADLCCLKGDFHNGEPTGSIQQINGIDTYIAKPAPETSNGNIILFFPDAFGLHMNNFLMMDAYAACGYLTLGVDYFLGDPVTKHSLTPLSDPNFDFEAWKNKHLHACEEAAERWVKAVKMQYGTSDAVQFAAVGYCWGARFVSYQLSSKGICKAGAIAHPSFLKESDVFSVKEPLFLFVPSTDKLFEPPQRSRTIEILTENSNRFNMQVFSNVGHGFASRARLTNPYEKWAKEQHFKSFVDWFDFWLTTKYHEDCRWTGCTKVFNLLDYTALSFPAGRADKKRDRCYFKEYTPRNEIDEWNWGLYKPEEMNERHVGLQLVGKRFEEEKVMGAAKQIERLL